jgi:hypothetical protein
MRVDPSLAARKVALDRLAAWLMIGLLVFTAVRPFDSVDWLIDNDETSRALTFTTALFFSLDMALLFVLGGVAAWFAGTRRSERRSTSGFVRERTVRLGVPLVTGMLVFAPFQAWVVSWHNGFYSGSFWGFVPVWVDNPIPASSPAMIGGPGGYLWFLAFLLAFGLLTWPLQGWLRGTGARWVRLMADSVTEHRGSILLGVVPLVAVRQALLGVSHDRYGLSSFAYFHHLLRVRAADAARPTLRHGDASRLVVRRHRRCDSARRHRHGCAVGSALGLLLVPAEHA